MSRAVPSPRVSVVMAVHDGEPYVGEGIASLLGQTLRDLELIVVDDGSTDRTAEIVRSFGDPRITLVHNERNLGLAASLNRGLALARGEFVARQDADDRSTPERLARQVAFMDAHPEVALVGSWYVEIDPHGVARGRRRVPTRHVDILWHLCLYCPFVHSAVLWRRAAVAGDVGGYDERLSYSMDYDLWRRIAARHRVANVPDYLLELRVHAASMTATYGGRAREGVRMRAANAARLLGWRGRDDARVEAAFEAMYAVVFGQSADRTPADVRRGAHGVERLHDAFVHEQRVGPSDALRQRRELRRRIARQTWRSARMSAGAGRRVRALALFGEALRHDPGATLAEAARHWGSVLRRGRRPGRTVHGS